MTMMSEQFWSHIPRLTMRKSILRGPAAGARLLKLRNPATAKWAQKELTEALLPKEARETADGANASQAVF